MTTDSSASRPSRLHVKGHIIGYKRGRRNTYHHTSIIKIEGVKDKSSESFYAGKKVAYIYKADKAKSGSKLRAVWGKLTRAHGSNGLFRAKFKRNLATTAAGAAVRVFLYPSRV